MKLKKILAIGLISSALASNASASAIELSDATHEALGALILVQQISPLVAQSIANACALAAYNTRNFKELTEEQAEGLDEGYMACISFAAFGILDGNVD